MNPVVLGFIVLGSVGTWVGLRVSVYRAAKDREEYMRRLAAHVVESSTGPSPTPPTVIKTAEMPSPAAVVYESEGELFPHSGHASISMGFPGKNKSVA